MCVAYGVSACLIVPLCLCRLSLATLPCIDEAIISNDAGTRIAKLRRLELDGYVVELSNVSDIRRYVMWLPC